MDKEYIKNLIQKILDKNFTNTHKRKIKIYNERLNFACPYCGDSNKNPNAKRGNLYFNSLIYICFNCDKKTSFDKFCKDHDEIIDPNKKLEIIENLYNNSSHFKYENEFIKTKLDKLINIKDLEESINKYRINQLSDFEPIKKNSEVYNYLLKRGITPELHKNIYQAKYWKNDNYFEWVVVLLNRKDDKILSIQIRNLKEGKNRMFKIFNYSNILEWIEISKNIKIDNDINETIIYDKLSHYFNILNVNFNDKITIFEGYIDSLFYPNSIGLVGVNTDSRFLENNNLDIQYFFDNDETGYRKAEEKLKKGYPVFLWKKLFNDIVKSKNTDEPDKLFYKLNKVKDLNKLNQIVPNAYSKLKLYNYFSNNILDLIWIPKVNSKKTNFNYN